MLVSPNAEYEYNFFIQNFDPQTTPPHVLGFVMLRFYFLWRANETISNSVYHWCKCLNQFPQLQKMLQDIATPAAVDIRPPTAWSVRDAIEDHLVLLDNVQYDSYESLLFHAEWIDKQQCVTTHPAFRDLLFGFTEACTLINILI